MPLIPERNYYSVAPLGNGVVMIGRQMALRGGIERGNAVNLIAWLIIATGATPEEVGREIKRASMDIGAKEESVTKVAPVVVPPPVVTEEVKAAVQPFVGTVDNEEEMAITMAIEKARRDLGEGAAKAVDVEELGKKWGG